MSPTLLPHAADLVPVRQHWRTDLVAGLTVGIVALPLALGFGVASGVGPAAGLVTAVVAGIIAAVFGGSNVQVSGPTGAMVVVLAPIVADHGVSAVALVSVLAGIMLIAAGVARLGRVVGIIPWPVIEGFTLGIAVIIGAQQIPSAFDAVAPTGQNAVASAWQAIQNPGEDVAWTLGIVALVVAIMVIGRRLAPRLPDSLVAVIVATLVARAFEAPLTRIGALPHSLPAPSFPDLTDVSAVTALSTAAFAVMVLAAIESLLSAKVAGSMADVGPFDPDRELVGQGLASVGSGAFGGMPATGAIARTAVNVSSGGRSRLASVTHGLVLLVVVYALSGLVSEIPLAALSGVLLVVATRMIDLDSIRALLRASKSTALIFVMTALITIAFDLIDAVLIGVVAAAFFALRKLSQSGGVQREPLPGPAQAGDERIALVTVNGPVFFAGAERVHEEALALGDAEIVILRLSQLTMLDATGARTLAELVTTLRRRGTQVLIKGVRPEDRLLLERTGVIHADSEVFTDLDAAVASARGALV